MLSSTTKGYGRDGNILIFRVGTIHNVFFWNILYLEQLIVGLVEPDLELLDLLAVVTVITVSLDRSEDR